MNTRGHHLFVAACHTSGRTFCLPSSLSSLFSLLSLVFSSPPTPPHTLPITLQGGLIGMFSFSCVASRGLSDLFVLSSSGIFRASFGPRGMAFGALRGPSWALPGWHFAPSGGFPGLDCFLRRPRKGTSEGARRPPEGPRRGPGVWKKVLQEGSWRLLADLKTRFKPKSTPREDPKRPPRWAPRRY